MPKILEENTDSKGRPTVLQMGVHTGMLESLGTNMYTSVGKSLVEFVANGYDADANSVSITIPFEEIHAARSEIREKAKKEVEDGTRNPFSALYDTLPTELTIMISDDGHGMSAGEVQEKFLLVNRNRREGDNLKSESGARYVMGRKGLGKLAGFGTAENIRIETKRKGENYSTVFEMDYR